MVKYIQLSSERVGLRRKSASDLKSVKGAIRKKILDLLRNQKEDERLKKSRIIQKKLFLTPEFRRATTILFYASFDGEVETFGMMKQAQRLGKKIALPIIKNRRTIALGLVEDLENDLIQGPYGIKQPRLVSCQFLDLKDIDLAVVPGVAFDKKNNRLGRGAGYYDRFLRTFPPSIPTFGLAFDFQLLESLPHHRGRDIPVVRVIVN